MSSAASGDFPAPGPIELCGGLLVAGVVLSVYMATMYRSVPGGDSGELIVAGCTMGIAHPPGYPLFTMLANLMHKLPIGSPAWRINLLSVLLSTASAWFNYWTVVHWDAAMWWGPGAESGGRLGAPWTPAFWHWSVSVWVAVASALLLAFCPLIWMYSIQAEVFAMNNMFVSLLTYLTVLFHQGRSPAIAQAGALVIGLGLSNQHTLIFYALPLVAWIISLDPRTLLSRRVFPSLIGCGLLGLTPYLYLPLAGRSAAFGAWGEVDSWEGFLTHFLRKEYGTFRLYSGNEGSQVGDQLVQALVLYCGNLQLESSLYVGGPLALVGLGCCVYECGCARSHKCFGAGLAVAFFFYMIVFHCLSNLPLDQALYFEVHKRFWMQAHIIAFGMMGIGLSCLLRAAGTSARALAAAAAVLLACLQCGLHYRLMDQSNNEYVKHYGMMHLDKLPENSILVVKGDVITNSIRYLQRCEGVRPDVQHLDQSMMTYEWFKKKQARHFRNITFPNKIYNPYKEEGYSMQQFLQTNALRPHMPTFLCGGWYHDEVPAHLGGGTPGFKTWPVGPCDRIRPDHHQLSLEQWVEEAGTMTPDYDPPSADKYPDGTWERITLTDYWSARHKLPYSLLMWAIERQDDQQALEKAAQMFDDLVAIHPDPPDYFYKNAGIAYGRLRTPASWGSGQPNHCKMVYYFARFLCVTHELPSTTTEILKIVKDYSKHSKRVKEMGGTADCDEDVAKFAKKAHAMYKDKGGSKKTDRPRVAAVGAAAAADGGSAAGASRGGVMGENEGEHTTVTIGGEGAGGARGRGASATARQEDRGDGSGRGKKKKEKGRKKSKRK